MDKTVLLHYLLDDHPRRAAKPGRIHRRRRGRGCTPETVVATVEAPRARLRRARSLIGTVHGPARRRRLHGGRRRRAPGRRLYGTGRLTFAESLLAARNILTGYPIETFSKSLVKARM